MEIYRVTYVGPEATQGRPLAFEPCLSHQNRQKESRRTNKFRRLIISTGFPSKFSNKFVTWHKLQGTIPRQTFTAPFLIIVTSVAGLFPSLVNEAKIVTNGDVNLLWRDLSGFWRYFPVAKRRERALTRGQDRHKWSLCSRHMTLQILHHVTNNLATALRLTSPWTPCMHMAHTSLMFGHDGVNRDIAICWSFAIAKCSDFCNDPLR